MFRPEPEESMPDFGNFQEEVDKLIQLMAEIPHALYAVLGFISEYRMNKKDLIEKHFAGKKASEMVNGEKQQLI
jgi:hypothetical protein